MAPRPTPMPDGSALAAAAPSSDAQRLLEAATHRGRVAGMSDPHLAQRAGAALERFLATAADPATRTAGLEADPSSLDALLTIFAASPYLAEIVISDPDAWEAVRTGQGRPERKEALAAALEADVGTTTDPQTIMRVLRRFKRRQTLRIAYGDVVAGQRLETVVQQISHVADCIVAAALRVAERRAEARRGVPRGPDGRRATIAALALGKLGGAELNYSSDVDLVFVHSDDGRVEGPKPGTNQEFFELVVQETVRLLAEPTDLGIAYRIDLRLRPHGAVGPASMACGPLLRYVDREGRTWERQAWLKARCVAGDAALGDRLLAALEPWIHRRWLTGADIAGIKALKRRIEQRAIRAGTDGADVKHGRGGIRDIEFTIQFLQLLNGGDAPRVRTGTTLEAIRRLTEAGALTDQEREILERNYTLLRTVEHRLQIVEDRQTHLLPRSPEEFGRLAARMGYGHGVEAGTTLRRDLAEATFLNRRILDHLLHDAFPHEAAPEPEVDLVLDPAPDPDVVRAVLSRHGFRDAAAAHRQLAALAEERVRFLSAQRCRHFLAAIAPRLLAALGRTPDPDATLATLGAVADSLGGKGVLWELFSAHEPSLDLTVRLCAWSPFLARLLVGNPGMLDELLDSLLLDRLPTPAELDAGLDDLCRNAVDIGPILQSFKASQQLRVGVRDVLGRLAADETTAALTAIAEAVVRAVMAHEQAALTARFGAPSAGAVVLAMGKFGGREMNYASDVDVVFLYDRDAAAATAGRPGAAGTTNAHFFGELARRTAGSATPTARTAGSTNWTRGCGRWAGPAHRPCRSTSSRGTSRPMARRRSGSGRPWSRRGSSSGATWRPNACVGSSHPQPGSGRGRRPMSNRSGSCAAAWRRGRGRRTSNAARAAWWTSSSSCRCCNWSTAATMPACGHRRHWPVSICSTRPDTFPTSGTTCWPTPTVSCGRSRAASDSSMRRRGMTFRQRPKTAGDSRSSWAMTDRPLSWTTSSGLPHGRDPNSSASSRRPPHGCRDRRRAAHHSQARGRTETSTIPTTTNSKFFFTASMLPKK